MKVFYLTASTAVVLIVVGLVCPPPGVIDSSIIAAVGYLLGFAALHTALVALHKGQTVRLTQGNTTVEVQGSGPSQALPADDGNRNTDPEI